MRTLRLNESEYWIVKSEGTQDIVDSDGYFTGEKEVVYSEPQRVNLHLFPANGDIVKRSFGEALDLDMVSSSTSVKLDTGTLLFNIKPISDYDKTYDYEVSKISKSLNVYQYGFKGRL